MKKMRILQFPYRDARLKVINNNIFLKDNLDAFLSSDHKFEKFLTDKKEIKELYLIGLDATLCINETVKDAVKRDYKTTVLTTIRKLVTELSK